MHRSQNKPQNIPIFFKPKKRIQFLKSQTYIKPFLTTTSRKYYQLSRTANLLVQTYNKKINFSQSYKKIFNTFLSRSQNKILNYVKQTNQKKRMKNKGILLNQKIGITICQYQKKTITKNEQLSMPKKIGDQNNKLLQYSCQTYFKQRQRTLHYGHTVSIRQFLQLTDPISIPSFDIYDMQDICMHYQMTGIQHDAPVCTIYYHPKKVGSPVLLQTPILQTQPVLNCQLLLYQTLTNSTVRKQFSTDSTNFGKNPQRVLQNSQ
eukprot:TRINITY_DN19985_c0_g1_i1.p1 TRINITY_DN19985_c0_g1~~TRINITY_DN19985_c0_g1_i1.p1  ORF type:complete len:295 (+),score=-18.14 TRINITY_DN19985_c0_g1_i1:98-886(+)